jgi:methyl-accepting chemotaxis protein
MIKFASLQSRFYALIPKLRLASQHWKWVQAIAAALLVLGAIVLMLVRNELPASRLRTLVDCAFVLTVVGSALCAWIVQQTQARLSKPIASAIATANRVASGDLTSAQEIRPGEGLAQLNLALYQMNLALASIVTQVRQSTQQIHSDTADISTGNLELAAHIKKQSASVSTIASRIREMNDSISQSSEHARAAASLTKEAVAAAASAWEDFDSVTSTMSTIHSSSKGIVDVIGSIEAIAFQTNILAINAAVESARAGDAGRGFAVVAQEVRQLAIRSSDTAKQVKRMIGKSFEDISDGASLVQSSSVSLKRLVTTIGRVSESMAAILDVFESQRVGIADVSTAVHEINDEMSESNSLIEESMTAANGLSKQTNALAGTVKHFKLVREPRIDVSLVAKFNRTGGERCDGTVVNLSASGLMIESKEPLELGQSINLDVSMPTPGSNDKATQRVSIGARVVRMASPPSTRPGRYGLAFTNVAPQSKEVFQAFLRSQLLERQQSGELDESVIHHSLVHIANLALPSM